MKYRITHTTSYHYAEPVGLCWNDACLLPRQLPHQHCLDSQLQIEPAPANLRERSDFFGNRIVHFDIQQPHTLLKVSAVSQVSINQDANLAAIDNPLSWQELVKRLETERTGRILSALPFLYDSPLVHKSSDLAEYARHSFAPERSLIAAVTDLMQRIYHDFTYTPGVTGIATPLAEVLSTRRGVCQDFAQLGIGCLRSLGLAARYVSGYIETLPPPGQKRLVGADASHAWFSVFAGDSGWIDFDPTNNQIPVRQHLTVAWGRDYSDVAPLRGIAWGGGAHKVGVSVDVARLPQATE